MKLDRFFLVQASGEVEFPTNLDREVLVKFSCLSRYQI